MGVKLNNPEQFCELVKCFYHSTRSSCKLTHDFRCNDGAMNFSCIYLTRGGKIRKKLDVEALEFDRQNNRIYYRDAITILAALMKCKHENKVK
jgi:hypothetical protein